MDYLLGGSAAVCAGFFSNPLDVIKTRQQLQGELQKTTRGSSQPYKGLFQSIRSVIKAEGLWGLQKGLGSALTFQFVLNSSRLGLYQTVDDLNWTRFEKDNSQRSPVLCVFWGGVSGCLGSALGCPFYMIKTQIQAQSVGKYAVGYQHHHKNTLSALINTVNKQGFFGLWRGFSGIVPRTVVASSAQLGSFSTCKDFLVQYEVFQKSLLLTAISSSMASSFCAVVCMTPFDVVATRMFNQGVDSNGKGLLYKNIVDCAMKTFRYEGLKGLYKGFVPNYCRTAPHSILNLTFWEQFKKWKNMYWPKEEIV
ncbi:solute carrier family 25 member 35-like [Episyrphus balteatus]|uniref:solute carrier family 25 member 35-like n=1 Tax=Episyrphus balteatus TaxID=286459 RepID=UPI0024862D90|nr:solute carrier family 25 member 35-like [Episyrphus balteatus]XP_055853846.1 solute carrier family 25 member 35-like [Episyrphus balteatus]